MKAPSKAWAGCIAALIASAATIAIAVLDNLFVLVFAIVFYLVRACAGARGSKLVALLRLRGVKVN